MNFENLKILVMGDVMLDAYLWGDVNRISPEAPVPVVEMKGTSKTLGGAGNVALNLAGLGVQVDMVSAIGDDDAGKLVQAICRENGINDRFVIDSRKTTIKTRVVAHDQQLIRIDSEDTIPVTLPDIEYSRYDAVVLSDYCKGFFHRYVEIPNEIKTFVDTKFPDWGKFTGAYCVTPNEDEWAVAQNTDMVDTILRTMGAEGMVLDDGEQETYIPSCAKEVYDVTGAGDTVVATLAAGVAYGMGIVDAAKLANRAAGIVVGKIGTHPITVEELGG